MTSKTLSLGKVLSDTNGPTSYNPTLWVFPLGPYPSLTTSRLQTSHITSKIFVNTPGRTFRNGHEKFNFKYTRHHTTRYEYEGRNEEKMYYIVRIKIRRYSWSVVGSLLTSQKSETGSTFTVVVIPVVPSKYHKIFSSSSRKNSIVKEQNHSNHDTYNL